ncbi:MAG TPA: GGDEF domain-containing protein [Gemmatimonadales bacterium]|nr:GGDEF domain-containing protein [Gemmatimonadales bacterium]
MLNAFYGLIGLEGIVVLATGVVVAFAGRLPGVEALAAILPPVVLVVGGFLAWRFQRGRPLLGLLATAFALTAFQLAGVRSAALLPAGTLVLGWVAILAAVVTAAARERAGATLMSPAAAIVAGAWLVAVPVIVGFEAELSPLLEPRWVPARWVAAAGVPEAVLIPGVVIVATLLGWARWRNDVTARGAAWGLVAGVIGIGSWQAPGAGLYAAAAGAAFLVSAVEEIHAVAFRDPLTGLPARRALEAALARLSAPYVVAMVDVDHFKRFNDTYGHTVGDQVLTMVATRLAQVAGARAFRYGGEEFTLLLPGRSLTDAAPVLEGARAAVEATTFTLRAPDRPRRRPRKGKAKKRGGSEVVAVTVSIGAAEPTAGDRATAVLEAADQALYRAKEGGRNRIAAG